MAENAREVRHLGSPRRPSRVALALLQMKVERKGPWRSPRIKEMNKGRLVDTSVPHEQRKKKREDKGALPEMPRKKAAMTAARSGQEDTVEKDAVKNDAVGDEDDEETEVDEDEKQPTMYKWDFEFTADDYSNSRFDLDLTVKYLNSVHFKGRDIKDHFLNVMNQPWGAFGDRLIGCVVITTFPEGDYKGLIVGYNHTTHEYHIVYEDRQEDQVLWWELQEHCWSAKSNGGLLAGRFKKGETHMQLGYPFMKSKAAQKWRGHADLMKRMASSESAESASSAAAAASSASSAAAASSASSK